MVKTFLSSESGAVAVDWTVMTAALVGLGLASVASVQTGTGSVAGVISEALSDASVMALDRLNQMGFDDGVFTGWSTTRTGFSVALGTFLGPFAGHEPVTHDVVLPTGATEATIRFDLLLLDSWDGRNPLPRHTDIASGGRGDGLSLNINGTEIGFTTMGQTLRSTPQGTFELDGTTYSYEISRGSSGPYFSHSDGGGPWDDSIWNVTVTAENPPSGGFQFGLASTTNSGIQDESFGIDNYSVTSN